ncbi:unnamed protein product [Orchesella dallaii]|uniref:Uncharacterized protein n=1 Tax=Orchesella dallaii TaxID=48710 RepID=A0ABP1SAX8_9HEXA
MTNVKQSCALQIQGESFIGTEFIEELLLIECAHLIKNNVKDKVEFIQLEEEITNHLNVHCVKATTEFLKQFKIRDIDWEREESFIPSDVKLEYDNFISNGEFAMRNIEQRRDTRATHQKNNLQSFTNMSTNNHQHSVRGRTNNGGRGVFNPHNLRSTRGGRGRRGSRGLYSQPRGNGRDNRLDTRKNDSSFLQRTRLPPASSFMPGTSQPPSSTSAAREEEEGGRGNNPNHNNAHSAKATPPPPPPSSSTAPFHSTPSFVMKSMNNIFNRQK